MTEPTTESSTEPSTVATQAPEHRAAARGPVLLAVEQIHVGYAGGLPVLRGVDLEVCAGHAVALLGANGSGKTTLLRTVTGLLQEHGGILTSGSVTFDGVPGTADTGDLVRRGMAQVLEARRLFRDLTVEENLLLGAATVRSATERRTRLAALCDRFPLLPRTLRTQAGLLSGGQQQIVAIARAIMSSPRLLILDEPSLGLSPPAVAEVRNLLAELVEQGTTLLLVEQNVRMALSVAHRGAVMERGRIVRTGSAADLLAHGVTTSLTGADTHPRLPGDPAGDDPPDDHAPELPWTR